MQRVLKLCGALAVLCSVAYSADGAPREPAAEAEVAEATVEELPQRPMTLQNGYHPGLFPFNKGQPFVVDPNMSAIDFNTKPPNPEQRSDDYYDYDTSKLEEVPYDYKGDPIDRKDVVVPNAPRPNDIKPTGGSGVKNKQTDIYQFLNLPVKYSSSDKFPLMSSSYANTKIQGSGSSSSSSSLSNHKMPATSAPATAPTTSWYDAVKTTSTTFRPTTTTTTTARPTTSSTTTTTTTTPSPPSQEYEEETVYDYDYYHPQEPVPVSDTVPVTASTTTTSTTTTTTASTTVTEHQSVPPSTTAAATPRPVVSSSLPSASSTSSSTTTTTSDNYDDRYDDDPPPATVLNKTTTTTTTARPEIDSKLDGTSFADYDTIKPVMEAGEHHRPQQHELYGASGQQHFKPMPGNYQFANDKTYPLITNSKVPMTFTAHVSSGISLNQREPAAPAQQQHQQQHHTSSDSAVNKAPAPVSETPSYVQQPNRPSPPEVQDSDRPADAATVLVHDGPKIVTSSSGSRPPPDSVTNHQPLSTYPKYKPPPSRPSENDQFEAVSFYKVRPDAQPFPGPAVVGNRPATNLPPPIQGRPYQPEPPVMVKTSHPVDRPPKPIESQAPVQTRPQQPYPSDVQQYVMKNKQPAAPQYVAPQSQPDTSKFKPPKHVINHFIKTQPNEDNKSYALQTSFSIGMDGGDRTAAETRPAQGIGQVLMVEDGGSSSSESIVNQTVQHVPASVAVVKPVNKATTSIPFVPPSRLAQKPPLQQQQYPRPQWENIAKPPTYYPPPPPKRDGAPPPQRTNLPNILPQFRPNAKVDAPPMMVPQSHSAATIERVQIPMDHLRPPPLPKPQFLKVDRNDEDVMDGETSMADVPEKETRILQRTGPQPAKVTTLQMIQHGASSAPTKGRQEDTAKETNNPVHVIYAANAPLPPRPVDKLHADDSVLLDVRDRSDVPILKTKTAINRPVKTDFPYQIVKPDDGQNMSSLEYKAYSPTKSDTVRPNDQELVPNLQDYVPVVTRGDPAANVVMPQKPITATLRTSVEDNHKTTEEGGHKPQLQNFQIPFQPSMKLPENSNGWSVVRKSPIDSASERSDETGGDAAASTEKFDPDNFKPQLVGGFMPINPLTEEAKDKKTAEQPERA